jgi:hypothetical protein
LSFSQLHKTKQVDAVDIAKQKANNDAKSGKDEGKESKEEKKVVAVVAPDFEVKCATCAAVHKVVRVRVALCHSGRA